MYALEKPMPYTIDRTFKTADFDDVVTRTRAALASQGFGVLTEINVKATLKAKIDADIDNYLILGACNPKMAHQAIQIEPKIGSMLPCNVIVRSTDGGVEVSAVDPAASMQAIDNDQLKLVAGTVRGMLENVVAAI
jgi:uncharacterized protein (DUF302 family)